MSHSHIYEDVHFDGQINFYQQVVLAGYSVWLYCVDMFRGGSSKMNFSDTWDWLKARCIIWRSYQENVVPHQKKTSFFCLSGSRWWKILDINKSTPGLAGKTWRPIQPKNSIGIIRIAYFCTTL